MLKVLIIHILFLASPVADAVPWPTLGAVTDVQEINDGNASSVEVSKFRIFSMPGRMRYQWSDFGLFAEGVDFMVAEGHFEIPGWGLARKIDSKGHIWVLRSKRLGILREFNIKKRRISSDGSCEFTVESTQSLKSAEAQRTEGLRVEYFCGLADARLVGEPFYGQDVISPNAEVAKPYYQLPWVSKKYWLNCTKAAYRAYVNRPRSWLPIGELSYSIIGKAGGQNIVKKQGTDRSGHRIDRCIRKKLRRIALPKKPASIKEIKVYFQLSCDLLTQQLNILPDYNYEVCRLSPRIQLHKAE